MRRSLILILAVVLTELSELVPVREATLRGSAEPTRLWGLTQS